MIYGARRAGAHSVVRRRAANHDPIRLRCVPQPDAAQAAHIDRLGIILAKRMRLAEHEFSALAISA
jgi:hypothetical protein